MRTFGGMKNDYGKTAHGVGSLFRDLGRWVRAAVWVTAACVLLTKMPMCD
ncbi:ORFS373W [Human betaherpesvirus 5]|nr:ORFS373W [Human betaherpesvirus 5]QHX40753.1 ORFS373W [Human betaherpesvirus 5]